MVKPGTFFYKEQTVHDYLPHVLKETKANIPVRTTKPCMLETLKRKVSLGRIPERFRHNLQNVMNTAVPCVTVLYQPCYPSALPGWENDCTNECSEDGKSQKIGDGKSQTSLV